MKQIKLFEINELKCMKIVRTKEMEDMVLAIYNFLCSSKKIILSQTNRFTLEDLWYSQYYWLPYIIKDRNLRNDAGTKQQLFETLESMSYDIEIDWEKIRWLEKRFNYCD